MFSSIQMFLGGQNQHTGLAGPLPTTPGLLPHARATAPVLNRNSPGADGGAQMFEEVASDAAKSQRKHKSQGVERLARYSQVSQCFTVKLSQITKSH